MRARTMVSDSRRTGGAASLMLLSLLAGLFQGCGPRAVELPPPPPGMVLVPGGEYTIGSGQPGEAPVQKVVLEPFYIDRYPVSLQQFTDFAKAAPGMWEAYGPRLAAVDVSNPASRPAFSMNWIEADAYARAAGGRLPTEAEWEAAARGVDARLYPWGNDWSDAFVALQARGSVPFGRHPRGASPFGAEDMVGSVFHWTQSACTLNRMQSPERANAELRLVKAGSWACSLPYNRASFRTALNDTAHSPWLGFRTVRPVNPAADRNVDAGPAPEPFSATHYEANEGLRQLLSFELLPARRLEAGMASYVAKLPKGAVVADVGSGIGFLTHQLSEAVGVEGRVYAVDIDKSTLDFVQACGAGDGRNNVTTVHSLPSDTKLPERSCDQVYLLGTVHCLSEQDWRPFIESCHRALKKDGLLIIEDNTSYPSVAMVAPRLTELGFELVESNGGLERINQIIKGDGSVALTDKAVGRPQDQHLFAVYRKR